MIKMSRKAKKAMAVALTAGMLASTAATPVMAATKGWKQNTKGWWYENADGTYPANKWEKINGKWYYFDANGYMLSGWKKINANWYYLGAANDGAMKASAWQKDANGLWYYLTDNGAMFGGGWKKINDKWYFFDNTGAMQSGVIKVEGETYYMGGNDQGWMQTGKVNVAGTEYTFSTDGACSDVAAPAAAKAFDKNGKEIAPEVDVEAVDGITGTITNALADYKAEYGNVLIAGSDAYLKVLVSDKNGNPVANTPVSLTVKINEDASNTDVFGYKGLTVQNTDADGYATFVLGVDPYNAYYYDDVTPTSGHFALLELTATAVATNQVYKTDLAFATIRTGEMNVLNDDLDSLTVKKSANATNTTNFIQETMTVDSVDSDTWTEYVVTQQVNEKGTTNNKVKFQIQPKIVIPTGKETSVVDKYQQDVNKEIKEYSVHQAESFMVENIPGGLKYATLNFSSIDVSEYTTVQIITRNANTGGTIETYELEGPRTQKNFGYQIPVQGNTPLKVEVKVISAGQVDDDQNGGVVVTDVTGLYDTRTKVDTATLPLNNTVSWSIVENKYSNEETLTQNEAEDYLPLDIADKYVAAENTYTYQVPVFPYTGNAILTVKDTNKNVVGYFTIPTENEYNDDLDRYENVNVLVEAENQAVLVSEEEAFNSVGTITADGNTVEVNSEKTGVTAIQAKINIAGFEDEINLLNNTVYTSVHWSPIPNKAETVAAGEDFYALVGQTITVKAQLVDNNGNKVSQADQEINYTYVGGEIDRLGAIDGTKATATSYTESTDANGQAVLKIASGDFEALVDSLEASSKNYNVQLMIGDSIVTKANLRWVEPGLSFTSSVDSTDEDYQKVITLDSEEFGTDDINMTELTEVMKKDTGSNWIFGYQVIGETEGAKYATVISGLKVELTKNGVCDMTTTGMDNGVAKLASTKAGATTLTGTINENSVVNGTDVVFNIKVGNDVKTYKNVGEGVPSIDTSLNLPIEWGVVGTNISVVTPKGTSMVVDGTETVYVKVVDAFGNVIEGADVEWSVTYSNGEEDAEDSGSVATNEFGLVPVTIYEDVDFIPTTATVTAKVGNETTQQTIHYKKAPTEAVGFDLVTATYDYKNGANPEVTLYFTNPVNSKTLKNDMFEITTTIETALGEEKEFNIPISNVKMGADSNKVVITLADQYKNGLDNLTDYTIAIGDIEVEGVQYDLCDTYGQKIDVNEIVFNTGMISVDVANQMVEEYIAQVKAEAEEAAAKADAQTALNSATIEVPVVAYGSDSQVTFTNVNGCTRTVTVSNINTVGSLNVFKDNSANPSELYTDVIDEVDGTCTVTVVYTNTTYNDVTKTVVYTVTVSEANDTIAFEEVQ